MSGLVCHSICSSICSNICVVFVVVFVLYLPGLVCIRICQLLSPQAKEVYAAANDECGVVYDIIVVVVDVDDVVDVNVVDDHNRHDVDDDHDVHLV